MTTKTFSYRAPKPFGVLALAAFGALIISYAFYEPFAVRLGRLVILDHPNSKYAAIALGSMFCMYSFHKWILCFVINSGNTSIIISNQNLGFPYVAGYSKSEQTLNLNDIEFVVFSDDEDDGESATVRLRNGKRFEFFAENFESLSEYGNFKKIIENVNK